MVVADRVVVELEARTGRYERNLRNAESVATRSARGITTAFRTIGVTLAALGAGIGVKGIIDLTSAWTDLNSQINLYAGNAERGAAVMDRIQSIARRTYSGLNQTAQAWLQNTTALSELGYSTQQQLDLTEALNNALVISATRGDQARSVMDAWSKAMALGELRGENLNTVIQSGGRLAEALAQSMGVSTNQLRSLGMEGKITTQAMYGVTSQLETLRREADEMPATVADGFQLLGDAIYVFIGNANEASGVSEVLAGYLIDLADAISALPENWYQDVFGGVGEELSRQIELAASDLQQVLDLVDRINSIGIDRDGVVGTWSGQTLRILSDVERGAFAAEGAFDDAAVALRAFYFDLFNNADSYGFSDNIVLELERIAGEFDGTSESAAESLDAILDLQEANGLNMAGLDSILIGLTSRFLQFTDAARDARAAADAVVARPATAVVTEAQTRAEQIARRNRPQPVDLDDDGGPIVPPTTPPGSGSGTPPEQRFEDALEAQRRQIDMLREETAVRAGLNPLVNDYGYALERLKIQQDLENEATRAGLALTPDRVAAISMLAEEYANASVEAARLEEQQQGLKNTVEEWAGVMQNATRGFIDDLLEGKDAAEAFGNVLRNIGSQLINMGLSSLFSPAGFGGLFGGFRANGGPVSSGRSYIVGERGPELFTPSSGGRITANHDLGGGGASVTFAPQIDARGADVAAVARIEEVLIRQEAEFNGRVKQIVSGANRNWRPR